jgi:hypothetical protein
VQLQQVFSSVKWGDQEKYGFNQCHWFKDSKAMHKMYYQAENAYLL